MKEMGLLDVTMEPFFADPLGEKDSTAAIQQAVNEARDSGLVCFFPQGTYLVSDMISCKQEVIRRQAPTTNAVGTRHYDAIQRPMVLMGSTRGKRPVIKLSDKAIGYDDPANPKKVIWIWAQGWFDAPGKDEPEWGKEQGNINFNHIFMNIDIDIRGHAGAIGIRHSGSQGSAMMNSAIYAEGAYSGMSNCCGQGGGTYNIEVNGGEYGIVIDSDSRFPVITSCMFTNQTKASIAYTGPRIQVPTLLAGCRFAPLNDTVIDMSSQLSHDGLLLIDCMIEQGKPGTLISTSGKENIFMENCYIRSTGALTSAGPAVGSATGWTKVSQFSSHKEQGMIMINGKETEGDIYSAAEVAIAPVYGEIHASHFKPLPSFEDKDAVNVKDFGATGDGETDDTEAFLQAIAKSDKVFVPKGHFKLKGTLSLKEQTQLFGLSKVFCTFGNIQSNASTGIQNTPPEAGDSNEFKLSTVDHEDSSPGLFFVTVGGSIDWKSAKATWCMSNGRPVFTGNGGVNSMASEL